MVQIPQGAKEQSVSSPVVNDENDHVQEETSGEASRGSCRAYADSSWMRVFRSIFAGRASADARPTSVTFIRHCSVFGFISEKLSGTRIIQSEDEIEALGAF